MAKLPTKKVKGGYDLSNIRFLIYGPWKIGKSTFCSKFSNTLFIGTETGLEGLNVYKMYARDWVEFLDIVDTFLKGKHDYKNLVIDTVDNAFKFCLDYCKEKYKVSHPSDLKWGKGWELFRSEFELPILKLSLAPYGLIFTAHEKENEITRRNMKIVKIEPSFPKQVRQVIGPLVDIIGHCYIEEEENDEGKYIERRYIEFQPTPYIEAGDRTGLLPARMPLRYTKFKKYFNNNNDDQEE